MSRALFRVACAAMLGLGAVLIVYAFRIGSGDLFALGLGLAPIGLGLWCAERAIITG
jgi:hypothetical protein